MNDEAPEAPREGSGRREGGPGDRRPAAKPGVFTQYKPEQGKYTRRSTIVGAGLLIAWGAWFIHEQLRPYEGDELWQFGVTLGIPMLFAVVLGVLTWRVVFANRKSSDFMIATEGEMKKVSWSSKGEVIGSTKVVIVFTVLMALLLFFVDVAFQNLFQWIGVLKVGN